MNSSTEFQDDSIDIKALLGVLRARRWTIIITIALAVGAALALSMARTPQYQAEARVFVRALPDEPSTFNPLVPVDMNTQAQIVASEAVAELVREELELDLSVAKLLENVSVTPEGETQVLAISYTSTSPRQAQTVAQAMAENYLDFRRNQSLDDIISAENGVQSRIQSTSEQLSAVTQDLSEAERSGNTALVTSYETQRSTLIARLGVLQQQLDEIQAQRVQSMDTGDIIEPADLPLTPSSPNHLRSGALALFLGAALGIGLAFLRERLDDRFKDRSDLERAVNAPVLGTVPRFAPPKKGEPSLVSLGDRHISAVEAYRSLRTSLQFITTQRGIKSVLITSPSESEGKTSTTANLGVLLAQTGRRVILVSSDLRRPTLAGYFGIEEGGDAPGLSTWLSSEISPQEIIKDPGIPNLRVVPSGPLPPNPAELMTSGRLLELIHLLEQNSDLVIFDSPPVLAVADAADIASKVGGIVLVVNAESSHRSGAIHAKTELERVGGKVVGAVLNAHDPSTSAYYSTSSYYYQPSTNGGKADKKQRAKGKRQGFLSRR